MDIKNILEVLEAFRAAGATASEVMADGKVGITDLPKLAKLIGPVKDAIQGLADIPAEIKDIDSEEATQVLNAVVTAAAAWTPLFTKAA